jgi:hypothetical protein
MHRVLVALLAALDALVTAAAGIAAALAPLTLLWVFALAAPAWGDLWPASAVVWQLGNLVPVAITLPDEYLAATGIAPEAATFTLSLAPLAFAVFTALSAARSGGRAAQAGAWLTGVASGTVVFAIAAAGVALTSRNDLASVELWRAVLAPALLYALPALLGAIVGAWREGDGGIVDAVQDRLETVPPRWAELPALVLRGAGVVAAGLVGVGAFVLLIAVLTRGSEAVALFQASNADALGATVVALGQLVYVPTLVAWGVAFVAGPGFAIGDASVAPGADGLGVLPGIPALGLVPPASSSWLLAGVLLPVAVGALAGWILRARSRTDAVGPRVALAVALAAVSGGMAALLAVVSSGSMGPGQLAHAGPDPGPLALGVGLEVLLGAGILLLSPRPRASRIPEPVAAGVEPAPFDPALLARPRATALPFLDAAEPLRDPAPAPDADPWTDAAPRRPAELPDAPGAGAPERPAPEPAREPEPTPEPAPEPGPGPSDAQATEPIDPLSPDER